MSRCVRWRPGMIAAPAEHCSSMGAPRPHSSRLRGSPSARAASSPPAPTSPLRFLGEVGDHGPVHDTGPSNPLSTKSTVGETRFSRRRPPRRGGFVREFPRRGNPPCGHWHRRYQRRAPPPGSRNCRARMFLRARSDHAPRPERPGHRSAIQQASKKSRTVDWGGSSSKEHDDATGHIDLARSDCRPASQPPSPGSNSSDCR